SANLDAIIEPIAKGGYYHAGQVCVSVRRIYVHAQLKQAFIDRLAARVDQLRVGDPTRAGTEVGPLITPTEADRVETWIDEAVTEGARRIGGGRLGETTLKPAILVDPPRGERSRRERSSDRSHVFMVTTRSTRRSAPPIPFPSLSRRASSRAISMSPSTRPSGSMLRR